MKPQKSLLFINGEPPVIFPDIAVYERIYCTDGAYNYLKNSSVSPDAVIGDFDSIGKLPDDIKVIATPDQNFTDFEKALMHLKEMGVKHLDVYGASGKEQDHFLGNLSSAYKFRDHLNICFYDATQQYFFAKNETNFDTLPGKTVSLYPFPEAKGIRTSGLKYPLRDETLNMHERTGVRNKAVAPTVQIRFCEGALIVFIEL